MKQLEKKFSTLQEVDNNIFRINPANIKKFTPLRGDLNEYITDCVNWGFDNEFKGNEEHALKTKRAILGKFGEFGIYKFLKESGYDVSYPDLKVRKKGEWDDGDLLLGEGKINIKTTKHFGNLLLLKKDDWDSEGNYNWGLKIHPDGTREKYLDTSYKYFFLCRIKPDIDDLIEIDEKTSKDQIIDQLSNLRIQADIPGFINIYDFRKIISEDIHIKKGQSIGARKFSEDLYYCQAGELRSIDQIQKKK